MAQQTSRSGDESRIARRRMAARAEGGEAYKAKRDKLISVAAEVFQEKGYEGATLNDIADRFGTDRASLYYYVAGKDELLQEAMSGILDKNVAEADRIAELDTDAPTKLTLLMQQILSSYEANYPYTFVFVEQEHRLVGDNSSWARKMATHSRRIETHAVTFIEQGIAEGAFRDDIAAKLAASAFFGMINWTHRWFKPGGRHMSEVADAFRKILIEGLQTPAT